VTRSERLAADHGAEAAGAAKRQLQDDLPAHRAAEDHGPLEPAASAKAATKPA